MKGRGDPFPTELTENFNGRFEVKHKTKIK